MRRLDIELPPFECVKYDDKGNVILKIPTPVDAYIQDVMPRKLLKQALGLAGVDSGESSLSETDDTTYAIKSLNFNIPAKREKQTRTQENNQRREQQEKGGEEEDKWDEEFLAFDCHISNPLTKE